ncbi:hypothetical protein [Actinomadura hibisca]|uniref:hypothetical protein n=1 Tax=Actinomadura hibisca TaxID=68565 RepID=UPI0008343A40|nr:hypothetical protein [Actinomadura hibisca]
MAAEQADAKVELAATRHAKAQAEAEAALDDLWQAIEAAARDGRTTDQLAEVTPFTGAQIRRQLRKRGVRPAKGGSRLRRG